MMKIIVDAGKHDQAFLEEQTLGWKELIETRLPDYPVEKVAKITGLSVETITKLAMDYASTKKSYIRANYGLNRHQNAGQMARAILLLPAITGAWREKCGGASFGNLEEMWLQFNLGKLQRPDLGERANHASSIWCESAGHLPKTWGRRAEMDPPIKSLFVYYTDPANCAPNTNNVRNGL